MIDDRQLNSIAGLIGAHPISEELVRQLRERFPEIHFTYCMDDDVVGAKPVFEDPRFNLFLVDSREHCRSFTRDAEIASGVVLAEIEPDL